MGVGSTGKPFGSTAALSNASHLNLKISFHENHHPRRRRYSSPDDSPLTEKGYLRKAVIGLNVVVTSHPKDGWPVNFRLNGAPSLVDAGSEYWPDVPPHFLSIGSSLTPDNLGSFFLTTIGGTAPFRLTI